MWHVTLGSGCPPRHPRNRKGAQLAVYENFIETPTLLTMLFVSDVSGSAHTHADAHFAHSLSCGSFGSAEVQCLRATVKML